MTDYTTHQEAIQLYKYVARVMVLDRKGGVLKGGAERGKRETKRRGERV